jgi:hypothetical protein
MRLRRPLAQRSSLAALTVLVLGIAAPAHAQQASPGAGDTGTVAFQTEFERADTNKDGKLSEEEAVRAGFFTDGSFKDSDRDLDGQVTLFELGDALQKRLRSWLSESETADADGDGYVSREEAASTGSSLLSIFERADRDGDGRVARDEIDLYTRDTYYSETADRGVVPNIIDKKF